MACIEVDSMNAEGGVCDPGGGSPTGGGVARNAHGTIVDGVTAEASAVTAVVRDASGATIALALIEVGPTLPGVKIAIANLGPAANPVAVDFLDAGGSKRTTTSSFSRYVVGWLVLMVVIWWVRPLGGTDRTGRLAAGVFIVALLALLSTFGGFYLIPAVLVWMALVATEPPRATPDGQQLREQSPHR